ncbi:MAG: hemolysin III family protein [Oscillospiraceae bacterium]|nr:hemolysin III family protein [Oscillospiraceae bacterium]
MNQPKSQQASSLHTPEVSTSGRTPYDALRPWSAITHGAGALLAVIGTILLLQGASFPFEVFGFGIYGFSMIALYTASTLYHCLRTRENLRPFLRKLDHSSICLLIAGSYTPICLLTLWDCCGPALLAGVWSFALAGIVLSVAWISAPRWVSSVVYLAMGWLVIFAIKPLITRMAPSALFWLVLGGVLYSVGGVLYALKWPGRNNSRFGCHEIFHLFILLGTVCQYMTMWIIKTA